ncbi:Helix-turn-helix transcriptional regulator [Sulfidibacter corallicola]|uniref:Helix-turn-helix transcriptional regulator n=1 Tax=Sulfidibacter corallicola TaxID=2818388 RepID=A0A8A4TH35_SULCO|nr:helix-turn-helix transcriptional regulator [Sulfidibacter corallicola]QTD48514.1 helix-turn-helix transcriptional regulator [Sulfidibacter corallicola]
MGVISLICALAAGHGLFLAVTMEVKTRFRMVSVHFFAMLLAALAFKMLHDLVVFSGLIDRMPHFLYTGSLFTFFFGPLVYFLVVSLTDKAFKPRWIHLLHFAPFLVFNLWRLPRYAQSGAEKLAVLRAYEAAVAHGATTSASWPDIMQHLVSWYLHPALYFGAALGLTRRWYAQRPKKAERPWFPLLVGGFLGILAIDLVQYCISQWIFDIRVFYFPISGLFKTLLVFVLAFKTIGDIAWPDFASRKSSVEPELSDAQIQDILARLERTMREKAPHRIPDLTVAHLAETVGVSERVLSRVLNQAKGVNFYEYVGGWRVEEAKSMLLDSGNDHLTIDAIAREAGFGSKTVFYRTFKRACRMTPTDFRKSHLEERASTESHGG